MHSRRWIAAVLTLCALGCGRHALHQISWNVLFGPILDNEMIVGHVIEGETAWLATGADAIERVDFQSHHHSRTSIRPLGGAEHIWGLAKLTGGEKFWTLIGRQSLAELDGEAEIVRRFQLDEPHIGIFGWGRDLVYQAMNLRPPAPALMAGAPGGAARPIWGTMKTREMGLNRGASAVVNLVSCGSSAGVVMPCWFPDAAALTLTDRSGDSREIALDGLAPVAPELLLASGHPRRPIRDAVVTKSNSIWVLGSGEPPQEAAADRAGGWILARYDLEGRLFRRVRLPEPARIFLGASDERCVLLAWDGRVVEVRP